MSVRILWIAVTLSIALLVPAVSWSDDKGDDTKNSGSESASSKRTGNASSTFFVSKNFGAPAMRISGATRSAGHGLRIEPLVPEEAGWTLRAQPVIYWYASEPINKPVKLVVRHLGSGKNVLAVSLPSPTQGGIQRIALADHGIELVAGDTYVWRVHVVMDEKNRNGDQVVGGGLERIEPSAKLTAKLSATPEALRWPLLADAGIWYDAVDSLSVGIDASPNDRALWNQRAAIFEQVHLPKISLQESAASGFEKH